MPCSAIFLFKVLNNQYSEYSDKLWILIQKLMTICCDSKKLNEIIPRGYFQLSIWTHFFTLVMHQNKSPDAGTEVIPCRLFRTPSDNCAKFEGSWLPSFSQINVSLSGSSAWANMICLSSLLQIFPKDLHSRNHDSTSGEQDISVLGPY